ncbi:MAG TPA: aldo/keto reductase [Kofleriaceae bacterium]|jgi:aryl-alcohol dehydrogenase-like predicted oxidoreductase|nr:aldo/keto reductase [Kofleriaceae bacterium]
MLRFANGPETIQLGDLTVRRLGFGAMRLPGKDVWGEPDDPAAAHAVLHRAVELGINLIDTAWYYGPHVANRLIVEALHPYPSDLVIATKLGGRRLPDKSWAPYLKPEELRAGAETDLRSLRLEQLPVVHLRWIEQPEVAFDEALDAMIAMQREGLIRHLALSNVNAEQLAHALTKAPIVAVQNLFNLGGGGGPIPSAAQPEAVLAACEQRGIAFLPFFPLAIGTLTAGSGALAAAAQRHNCTPAQLAISWLLARSPVMLPIPGTGKISHLDENCGAIHVALEPAAVAELAPNR